MNSSTQRIQNIIIDCSIITLNSVSICISTGMFGFIVYSLITTRNSPHRVALLLTANMYFAILLSCILLLKEYARVLPGHLYSLISLNDGIYCQTRAYFLWSSNCAVYYSTALQSIYRLCRVVFYTKHSLQSFQLYQILIITQWIICFLIMIPALLLGDFKYLVNDYLCQNDYTNYRSACVNGVLAYGSPMNATMGCYFYTLKKMRRGNNNLIQKMTHIQQMTARRDLVVLFRICILLGLLMTIPIPAAIAVFIRIFTGYLPWWLSQIQWLVFSLSTSIITVVLALISPHVKNLCAKTFHHNAITPVVNIIN